METLRRVFDFCIDSFKNRPRGTVRSMFSLSAIALFLSAAVLNSSETSYVKLELANNVVEAGDLVTVNVYANAHVPVNAVDVTLRFDGKAVEVVSVDRGESVLTIWTEDPIVERNRVILRGGTFRKGFLGEHLLARVELRTKQTGQSKFAVSDVMLLAGDGSGTPVEAAESNQSIASLFIYDANTSPADIGVDVAVTLITDLDGDGKITLRDISAFMSAWTNQRKTYDFNGDGRMTFRDFSIILADFFLGA